VGNETSIKVDKSKKTLNIPNRDRSSPINNGLNFMKIHVNTISKDDVTEKFNLKLMEFTLLQFGIKSHLSKHKVPPLETFLKPDIHGVHGPPCSLRK